ncbi:TPA: hypothetical protein ACKQLR_006537 [Pseudomonas aeruginosa]
MALRATSLPFAEQNQFFRRKLNLPTNAWTDIYKRIETRRGVFQLANSASADQITRADIGKECFIVDDQTVAKTSATDTRSVAGVVRDVDDGGVWVEI